jgi:hypothetical protein
MLDGLPLRVIQLGGFLSGQRQHMLDPARKPAELDIFNPLILPPFATNSVEKPGRLFARKHHADIAGRNPR